MTFGLESCQLGSDVHKAAMMHETDTSTCLTMWALPRRLSLKPGPEGNAGMQSLENVCVEGLCCAGVRAGEMLGCLIDVPAPCLGQQDAADG